MDIQRMTEAEWAEAERRHRAALEPITSASLARRGTGVKHPVYDFLFTYFSYPPSKLLRYHPGPSVTIEPDLKASQLPHYIEAGHYVLEEGGYKLNVAG